MDLTHKTQEFLATLHVIAAGEGLEINQKAAVEKVFVRLLDEAGQAVRGDPKKIRRWLIALQGELKSPHQVFRTGRFALLRDHAQELVADWLQKNADNAV
jgi:hypothetical protein